MASDEKSAAAERKESNKAEDLVDEKDQSPGAFPPPEEEEFKPLVNPSYYGAHAVDRSRAEVGPTIEQVEAAQRALLAKALEDVETPKSVSDEQALFDAGLAQMEVLKKAATSSE